MIEAEWLGGPEDGALLALRDDIHEVMTAHPPPFDWRRENVDANAPIEVKTLVHRVIERDGKWYIVW